MTDKNNNINKLTSAYLEYNMSALSNLIDSVKSTMDCFVSFQTPFNAIENLSNTLSHFTSYLDNIVKCFDISPIIHTSEMLLESFKGLSIPAYDFSSLIENIHLERDSVTLNDEAIETLTQLFNDHQEPTATMASRMSIKDFLLVVLLPLLCTIIPMIQNSYYHKLDAIESQKNQIMEVEYQEAIIKLETQHTKELEELNNNINALLQYLESVQDNDLADVDVHSPVPGDSSAFSDFLLTEDEADVESDNYDMNQLED